MLATMHRPTQGRSARVPSGAAVRLVDRGRTGGPGRVVASVIDYGMSSRSTRRERRCDDGAWPRSRATPVPPTGPARCARRGAAWRSPSAPVTTGRIGATDPGRPRRRVLPRLHLPEGIDAEATARRPRSAPPADDQARRRARRGRVGRGVGGDRARPRRDDRPARSRVDRRLRRQPVGAQPVGDVVRAVAAHRAGTRQQYSASTVDQMPRQVASAYVFGTPLAVPVPDLDRTDYLLILGANPYASNGSLCTAPDFPGRIEAIRARGGKVVVVDPRRSKTAEEADEWLPIRPGTDALFLTAIVNVLFVDGLADPGRARQPVPRRCRRVRRRDRAVHAGAGGRGDRTRRGHHPPDRSRDRSGADRRRLRAHRHDDDRVRHDGVVAGRRRQHPDRQPRPAGRSRCSRCPSPAGRRLAARPAPVGIRDRSWRTRGCSSSRGDGGVPGRGAGGGDPRARRGPGPGDDHASPATRCSPLRTASGSMRPSPTSTSW